jgi:hypothetical protein
VDPRRPAPARHRAALLTSAAVALGLLACGDSSPAGSDTQAASTASTSDANSTSQATSGAETTTIASTTNPATSAGPSSSASASTGGETETGGEPSYCKFGTTGDSSGATEPWLEVLNNGVPIMDGQTLLLQCGFQGLFMFEVWPYVGGYAPVSDYSHLSVTLEIGAYEGNPNGHLWQRGDYQTFIGCEDPDSSYEGGHTYSIQMIPDDEIIDKSVLNGVPATLTVVMNTPNEGSVEVSAELVIEAIKDDGWMFCEGY